MLLSPSPAGNGSGRISQVLPTVKCSNCNLPVALAELGDHVCAPSPPVPPLPKTASLRIQSRVPATPPPKVPIPPPPSTRSSTMTTTSSPLASRSSVSSSISDRSRASRPSFYSTHRPIPSTASIKAPSPRSETASIVPRSQTPASPTFSPTIAPARTQTPSIAPTRTQTPNIGPTRTQTPSIRTPMIAPARTQTPVMAPTRTQTPSMTSPRAQMPSVAPFRTQTPSILPTRTQTPGIVPPSPFQLHHAPQLSVASTIMPPTPEPDTKIGGEAGMAGVGRRGFAAAARAAMFASPRPNVPRFLDIDAAINVTGTPPLSSSSISSPLSPGPVSPLSQFSISPTSRSPPDDILTGPAITSKRSEIQVPPLGADIQQPPPSPLTRLPFFEKYRNNIPGVGVGPASPLDDDNTPNSSIPTAIPSTAKAPPSRSATQDSTTQSTVSLNLGYRTSTSSKRSVIRHKRTDTDSSGSEYGLAYADSTDYEEEAESSEPPTQSAFKFPSRSSSRSSRREGATPVPGPRPPRRRNGSTVSSASSASSYGLDDLTSRLEATTTRDRARSNASSTSTSSAIAQALGLSQSSPEAYVSGRLGGPGAPGSGMKRRGSEKSGDRPQVFGAQRFGLKDEGTTILPATPFTPASAPTRGSLAHRSNTVQAVPSSEPKTPKLPARAKTERGASLDKAREEGQTKKKKDRVCVRCENKIEDGRWIQVDSGGVLCERCWKNMYLPKCRRCNLPIEKQAVSSKDGQLKGKYHKDCFNCFTCNKPFPDKTFYVYDGRPLCKYHYHEANNSLCAAATCGQPIEGPCAVSHAGDRYHPEHLLCEYEFSGSRQGKCQERLLEYWEVDGRMLCEKHANARSGARFGNGYDGSGSGSGSEDSGSVKNMNTRAMKRVTRFIDLSGVGDGLGDLR